MSRWAGSCRAVSRVLLSRNLRLGLMAVAATFLIHLTWSQSDTLEATLRSSNMGLLALSVGLGIVGTYLSGPILHLFLCQHGVHVGVASACRLQMLAQLGKYVPGKIWGSVMQAQVTGTTRIGGFVLAGVDTTLLQVGTLAGTGAALVLMVTHPPLAGLVFGTVFMLMSWLASKALLSRLAALVLPRRDDEGQATGNVTARARSPSRFLAALLPHTLVTVGSLVLLLLATTPLSTQGLLIATGSMLLAWFLGALVVVFPSGLGVRELAFITLAQSFSLQADIQTIAAIAVLVRCAQLAQDLITGLVYFRYFLARGHAIP